MHSKPNKNVALALITRSETTNDPTDATIAATSIVVDYLIPL